ncbi:hypothetical protein EOL96_02220 [Candidatus Saccharibacteria bacterium]|nr:hypothetical protein [Candidatus Saccharibacteria bacterium]
MYSRRTILTKDCDAFSLQEPSFGCSIQTVVTPDNRIMRALSTEEDFGYPDSAVIYELAWSGFVDRVDEIDRIRMISQALNRRVVAIDNLGVGAGTSQLSGVAQKEVRSGNFDTLSKNKLEVFRRVAPNIGRVALFGWSMGSSMAISMAKNLDDVTVEKLILAETVGLDHSNSVQLGLKFGIEAVKWYRKYLTQNSLNVNVPAWMSPPLSDSQRATTLPGLINYPIGLTHYPIQDDISAAYTRGSLQSDTKITIVNTANSGISSSNCNDRLAQMFIDNGAIDVTRIEVLNESHGMVDAPTKLDALLRECV